MAQNTTEQEPLLVNADGLRCRTCLNTITTQKCYLLTVMANVTKTIKEMIIFCIPQMATTLSDDDVVCYKCLEAIEFCVQFIESCLEVEQKIKNSDTKEIVIDYDDLDNYKFDVSIDHDYVKMEPDETAYSQNLDMQSNSLINQPSKSNSDESGMNTQLHWQTLKGPHSILKSGMSQENLQVEETLQSATRNSYKCGYCSKTYRTENCLLDHMRRMHNTLQQPIEENKVVSPTLDECPSSSDEKNGKISNKPNCDKRLHKKREKRERYQIDPIIKCPFCVEKLRLCAMEAHLREHNQGQTELAPSPQRRINKKRGLTCKTCSKRFASKDDFKVHLEKHPPYICDQCGKRFIEHSSFSTHKNMHNDPNTYICEYCGKCYKDRHILHVHLKIHENKKYNCEICPKVFNTQLHLKRHLYHVHTTLDVGQCSQCGRVFKNRGSLTSHVRLVHLKLKPYKCEICERQFGRADYLRLHIKTHTKEPGRNKPSKSGRKMRWKMLFPDNSTSSELLPCKFCGKRFQGVPKLKMHLETHVRRFPCQFCPLTFAKKQYCKRHELLHNGSESFIRCNICWKRMKSEKELEEHVKMKHNRLKYACHVCGEMFHKTFLLNQHSLREHNNSLENEESIKQIIYESLLEVTGSNET